MRFGLLLILIAANSVSSATLTNFRDTLLRVDLTGKKIISVDDPTGYSRTLPKMLGIVSVRRTAKTIYAFSRLDSKLFWSDAAGSPRWNAIEIGSTYDGITIGESLYAYRFAGKRNRFIVRQIVKGKVVGSWQSLGAPVLQEGLAFITSTGMLAIASASRPTVQLIKLQTPVASDVRMLGYHVSMLGYDGRVAAFECDEWVYRFDLVSRKLQKTRLKAFGAIVVNGALIVGEMEGRSLANVTAWDGKRFKRLKLGLGEATGMRFVSDGRNLCFIARGRGSCEKFLYAQIAIKSSIRILRSEWVMGWVVQRDSLAFWRGRLWIDLSNNRLKSISLR